MYQDENALLGLFQTALEYYGGQLVSFTSRQPLRLGFEMKALQKGNDELMKFTMLSNRFASKVIQTGNILAKSFQNLQSDQFRLPFMKLDEWGSYLGSPVYDCGVCVGAFEVFDNEERNWTLNEKRNAKICAEILEVLISPKSQEYKSTISFH